jgi:hypothetical protein
VTGKTDLLIRVADQPLFIGECKIWSGPDQLLGYTTWRDGHPAGGMRLSTAGRDAGSTR